MKLLVLNPFGSTEPFAEENLRKVARPDTRITVENIREVFPLNYNTYSYNLVKCANATAERIVKAEKEGYDGVMISCMADPGLLEARQVVDIPVLGTLETTGLIAQMIGRNFSIIATDREWAAGIELLVSKYNWGGRFASVRHIGISASKLYPEFTSPEELERRTLKAARKCVEEDQAEVLVAGCTILGAILSKLSSQKLGRRLNAPIVDPMAVTLKMTEAMVEMRRVGIPIVSRVGLYKKPPQDEFVLLREYLREHKSPEATYYVRTGEAPRKRPKTFLAETVLA